MHKKILVALVITILFLGVGIQPAIAIIKEKINHPPSTPTIEGSYWNENGLYCFIFNTTDPDGDLVFYYIDWGDGTFVYWIGPFFTPTEICHEYPPITAIYEIRIKVKDIYGAESDWAKFYILITRTSTVQRTKIANDDCDICPLINRINDFVDKKDFKKLSFMIDGYFELYRNLKLDSHKIVFKPICVILNIIFYQYLARIIILSIISAPLHILFDIHPKLDEFYHSFLDLRYNQLTNIFFVANDLGCNWAWFPFNNKILD